MLKVLIKPYLIILCMFGMLVNASSLNAQSNDPVLIAEEYLNQGEVDKAKVEFEKLAQ